MQALPRVLNPVCAHCGSSVPVARAGSSFCCGGCEAVYEFIHRSGLELYYKLGARPTPATERSESVQCSLAALDEPAFRQTHEIDDDAPTLRFYIEGVHCIACVWLIEKLPELDPGVASARLDFAKATVSIELKRGGLFAPTCALLEKIGYRPHPILDSREQEALENKETRRMLLRLAIAGASAGNVMMASIPLYSGAPEETSGLFRWLVVAAASPAFLYSALPFYRSALGSLRSKSLSIDVPIVIALVVGFGAALVAAARGSSDIYLDSLTGLIFLLLGTRYYLRRLQQSQLSGAGLLKSLIPARTRRLKDSGEAEWISAELIRRSDRLLVSAGESFPIDGTVTRGRSTVDTALMTGEATPSRIAIGSPVLAGTINLDAEVEIEASCAPEDSQFGQIARALESVGTQRSKTVQATDRAARIFTIASLSVAAGVLLYFGALGEIDEGLRRSLTLIIAACPCALALATPLTFVRSYKICAREGIVLKSPNVLEELIAARRVCFDKTGTLTQGTPQVSRWESRVGLTDEPEVRDAVYSLELRSRHPSARAIVRYLESSGCPKVLPIQDFVELPGEGVQGRIGGSVYSVGRPSSGDVAAQACVLKDGTVAATIRLEDMLREDAARAVREFERMGMEVHLLSGDHSTAAQALGEAAGIDPALIHARMLPTQKAALVEELSPAIMIGDGANDAVALKGASVGIAVMGGLETSLRAADIVLTRPGVLLAARALEIARETRKVLIRNFSFSIAYNVVSAALAVSGLIGPLFAAVVMPASALTVFLSSARGTRSLRKAVA